MIKTLDRIADGKSIGTQLNRELVEVLMPELRDPTRPLDQARLASALQVVDKWHQELIVHIGRTVYGITKDSVGIRSELEKAKAATVAAELRVQELQGDLRAAIEGRGMYESKVKTELEAKLAHKERMLTLANELAETRGAVIEQLQAEIKGRLAAVQGYELSISQLTTAAANNAEQARREKAETARLMTEARQHLSEARDNIDDRWGGKAGPFMEAIRNDIVLALTKLPPA